MRPNCMADREKLDWDDHDGFLMNFRWPCNEGKRNNGGRLLMETARACLEASEDRVENPEDSRATIEDYDQLFSADDHHQYYGMALSMYWWMGAEKGITFDFRPPGAARRH